MLHACSDDDSVMAVADLQTMELSTWRVLCAVVTLLVVYCWRKLSYWSSRGVPSVPILRTMLKDTFKLVIRKIPIWKLENEIYHEYGGSNYVGIYNVQLKPSLMIRDPDLVKRIMIQDFDHFPDRLLIDTTDQDDYVREMLTMVSGSHWKNLRCIMSPTFTSGKMRRMYPLLTVKADILMKHFTHLHHTAAYVNMKASFAHYVMDVIATCAFGIDCNTIENQNEEFSRKAGELFQTNARAFIKAFALLLLPKIVTSALGVRLASPAMDFFRDVIVETIKLREGQPQRGDFLDLMLEQRANQTSLNPKYPLKDVTIVAQSVIFLVVGHETTANMLAFTTFLLAKHPHQQRRLREELRALLKEHGCLSYQTVMEAPFLDACISESLRLYPPLATNSRECRKDYILPGTNVEIKKGHRVTLPVWCLQHDPRYWSNPEEFCPDRFLPENKPSIINGTYLPFGLGPRNCIGMRFALMESKLVLARTVLEFEMSPAPGHEELDLSIVTMKPKDDLRLILTPIPEDD